MRTIASAPVVLSLLATLSAAANAGIEPTTRHVGSTAHRVVEQTENPISQERAPGPTRPSTDERGIGGHDRRSLPPITRGMQAPTQKQQFALAGPSAGSAKTMRDLSGGRPADIVIDVIVAYTRKAAHGYADIEHELVALAIEEANRSFRLSNLGHISLRLVHTYQTDYVEDGAHFDHVWRLADKGDGYMEEIHGLRDRFRADVAVLIVDDPKGCGLATRVGADADEAFAVVHHACAAASYTVAHEVGHLIGARHELSFVNGTKWRDIMAYKDSCGGCPRMPVWSSPTVLVNGEPAGTVEFDNARVIAEQAGRVAAFR